MIAKSSTAQQTNKDIAGDNHFLLDYQSELRKIWLQKLRAGTSEVLCR